MSTNSLSPHESAEEIAGALAQAVGRGWMSEEQYRYIVERLQKRPLSSLLVFGVGYDSELWLRCGTGGVAFVEDDGKFLTLAPASARVVLYEYSSRVGEWHTLPEVPVLVDRRWDFVLADGPAGFSRSCPGRQFPIEWSRQLANQAVFVHDYERPWERAVCDRVWGAPTEVIRGSGRVRGELAVFDCRGAKK